jgi:hypothetical protein
MGAEQECQMPSGPDSKSTLLQPVSPATSTPNVTILGREADIVEQFLQLLVTRYDAVDKANYFLERRADISGANIGMANLRDAISHLLHF